MLKSTDKRGFAGRRLVSRVRDMPIVPASDRMVGRLATQEGQGEITAKLKEYYGWTNGSCVRRWRWYGNKRMEPFFSF
jgi:hypothetical protein